MAIQYPEIIQILHSQANPLNMDVMARFEINQERTPGISIAVLRPLTRRIAADARRELTGESVQSRLKGRSAGVR
jgi:hypothetical protein